MLQPLLSVKKIILTSFISSQHLGKSYAVDLNDAHEKIQDLALRIKIELELMNVARELDA